MKTEVFNNFPDEYDMWFDNESTIYNLELKVIKKMLPEKGEGIEIGSGTGRFAIPSGISIGVEPSLPMGNIAVRRGLDVIGGIAESLPLRTESFDFVLFSTVICFFDSPETAFLESFRILRPGGSVLVGLIDRESYLGKIYNEGKEESKFFKDACFYSVSEISRILTESGYESLEYAQALIFDRESNTLSEKVSGGYGEGSYIVVKGVKNTTIL